MVHLSDIHLKETENSVFKKVEKLISAIQNEFHDSQEIFFIISGDVAFSGKEIEYENAIELFENIREKVEKYTNKKINFIFTPGNHDCDFNVGKRDLRKLIINNLQDKGANAFSIDMINECCAAQENFFNFSSMYEDLDKKIYDEKIYKVFRFDIENQTIIFNCFNSSWISELHEQPGRMIYPFHIIEGITEKHRGDLHISIVHHPLNWLEPMNALDFRNYLEDNSDLILTGHEHHEGVAIRQTIEGNSTMYIEGGVFQDNYDSTLSEFHVVHFNLDSKTMKIKKMVWQFDKYTCDSKNTEWVTYIRGGSVRNPHTINKSFEAFLNDPGAAFYHPRKTKLELNDIYIAPNFKRVSFGEKIEIKEYQQAVNFNDLFNAFNKKYIVFGEERAGKTALCKVLYSQLYSSGKVPVYIEGHLFNSFDSENIIKIVSKQYQNQYSTETIEDFEQLSNDDKIIIIDDFHKIKFNSKFRKKLLEKLVLIFPNIVLSVNSVYRFEEIVNGDNVEQEIYNDFIKVELLQFGHVLRSKIINNWVSLGQTDILDENTLLAQSDRLKRLIDTIIGNNFVPSYPFFLLTLLQANEAGASHNLKESSYGHYYDVLIKTALSKINIKNEEIDAYYGYLTELSNFFSDNNMSEINKDDFIMFHRDFCNEYYLYHDFVFITQQFCDVSILEVVNGTYRFKYKYIYYYFVARHLANNITEEKIRNKVQTMCRKLYIEEYANIIMFLTHMSKDPYIHQEILGTAKSLFSIYPVARLEEDVNVVNKLIDEIPQLVMQNIAVREAREAKLQEQDELELIVEAETEIENYEVDTEKNEIDLVSQLDLSFKTLEIIGQILKNYYGSIKGQQKLILCQEAYNISLRSISSLFTSINENPEGVVNEVQQLLNSNDKKINDSKLLRKLASKFIFSLSFMFSYVFIKKVSNSIGSENLTEVFKLIRDQNNSVSVDLIDVAIKLEHLNTIPFQDIDEFKAKTDSNFLALGLLKKFMIDYLYMYDVDYKTKQRICDRLGISIQEQLTIEMRSSQKKRL